MGLVNNQPQIPTATSFPNVAARTHFSHGLFSSNEMDMLYVDIKFFTSFLKTFYTTTMTKL